MQFKLLIRNIYALNGMSWKCYDIKLTAVYVHTEKNININSVGTLFTVFISLSHSFLLIFIAVKRSLYNL